VKRKYSLILLILILAILICCIFTSCKNKNSIDYKLATFDSQSDTVDDWDKNVIIKSKYDYDQLFSDNNIKVKHNEYDEDYFVDNALVVCMFTWGYLSPNLTIDSVLVLNNELVINIINREKKWTLHLTMAEFWVCILEVNNEDIKNVDDVEVNIETKKTLI